MLRFIDRSRFLQRLIDGASTILARQRGLPVVIGLALILVALFLQVINVFAPSLGLELLGIVLNGIGVAAAFIGLLLATPLGK